MAYLVASEQEQCGMHVHCFAEGQPLDIDKDDGGKKEHVKHVEWEGIDVDPWQKKNAL